jgi:hypothetical protein
VYQIDDILYIGSNLIDIRVSTDSSNYYIIVRKDKFESMSDDDIDSLILSKINKTTNDTDTILTDKLESIKARMNAKRGQV